MYTQLYRPLKFASSKFNTHFISLICSIATISVGSLFNLPNKRKSLQPACHFSLKSSLVIRLSFYTSRRVKANFVLYTDIFLSLFLSLAPFLFDSQPIVTDPTILGCCERVVMSPARIMVKAPLGEYISQLDLDLSVSPYVDIRKTDLSNGSHRKIKAQWRRLASDVHQLNEDNTTQGSRGCGEMSLRHAQAIGLKTSGM